MSLSKDRTMLRSKHRLRLSDKRMGTIATQQDKIETLQQEVKKQGDEIISLQKKRLKCSDQKVFLIQKGPADKILIEKKERRLTLISRGEVLKTYKIALGGDPNGPKERQGDNRNPGGNLHYRF